MIVNTSDFENALETLRTALQQAEKADAWEDDKLFLTVRDGAIQRFEYCYESAWKLMRRVLSDIHAPEFVQALARKDLYRHAWEAGIIEDPQLWFRFHEARNLTSHTYRNENAEKVFELLPLFLSEAEKLKDVLGKRET